MPARLTRSETDPVYAAEGASTAELTAAIAAHAAGDATDAELAAAIAAVTAQMPRLATSTANHALAALDTTPEDVPGLVLPVEAGSRYLVEVFLKLQAPSNVPDFKPGWSQPVGSSIEYHRGSVFGGVNAGAAATGLSNGNISLGLDNLTTGIQLLGWFTTAATAGNLQFQASQNTSDAGVVTVHAGSTLRLTKLAV